MGWRATTATAAATLLLLLLLRLRLLLLQKLRQEVLHQLLDELLLWLASSATTAATLLLLPCLLLLLLLLRASRSRSVTVFTKARLRHPGRRSVMGVEQRRVLGEAEAGSRFGTPPAFVPVPRRFRGSVLERQAESSRCAGSWVSWSARPEER